MYALISRWLVVCAFALLAAPAFAAPSVVCHYTYGGETRLLVARPVHSPYGVPSIEVGSYFRLRVVFQDSPPDLASVKVYTYANREEHPVLIHQASFPYPPPGSAATAYGFTGRHSVYEPVRDTELEYWCGMETDAATP